MTQQLTLITTITPARPVRPMARSTREIGKRGVAEARAVLHGIPRRLDFEPQPHDPPDRPARSSTTHHPDDTHDRTAA